MPKKDIINQKFGKLTVLEETQNRASNGSILWKCECECGNIVFSTGSDLKSGRRVSCGKCPKYENLIGQKFNLLTVIADTHTKINGKEVWECQCECGNIIKVHSANLKNGSVKSCGCLANIDYDLTNQRFGKLVVKYRIDTKNRNISRKWLCQCDCGNEVIVNANRLRSGQVNSCGCLKQSVGELKIAQFLLENNIPFETQKMFNTAKYSKTNMPMKFDFYLPLQNILIEYDGMQHFYPVEYFGGEETFQIQQNNDKEKNDWCEANNIQLKRIKYTKNEEIIFNELQTVLTRCMEVK